ncbi:MAG: hypothetical protein ABJN61_11650 [Flavobacteriaceae bacterium]|uniref:hypothetical protein n=1 Tax=Nonlabens ulvanivorans TaxID=906888 RepID=UPI0032997110
MDEEDNLDAFNTISEGEADYNHSKWFGAIFYYLINLGRKPYKYFTNSKFSKRNLWTGYFLKLLLLVLLIYLGIILF